MGIHSAFFKLLMWTDCCGKAVLPFLELIISVPERAISSAEIFVDGCCMGT
jgi:hypothetical protein